MSEIVGGRLTQSTKASGEYALYTISFDTNNPIPPNSAIVIQMPPTIKLKRESSSCTITTIQQIRDKCKFSGYDTIKIRDGFTRSKNSYSGQVQIEFRARNPLDNEDEDESIKLEIYDADDFEYLVDVISGSLNPLFKCAWPCATCSVSDETSCESCHQGLNEPNWLQYDRFSNKGSCKTKCEAGYTYDRYGGDRICEPCDKSCATCRPGHDVYKDKQTCTSCARDYPYSWPEANKCFQLIDGCAEGSYEAASYFCRSCPAPCTKCQSEAVCERCDPLSDAPLLQNGVCVDTCLEGKTKVFYDDVKDYGECVNCNSTCFTCADF